MVQLARGYGRGPMAAKDLAEHETIPRDFVDQLLMRLRRGGLVVSQRGAAGGYSLSRDPGKIDMASIVAAVEGQVFEEVCGRYSAGDARCRHQAVCGIRPVWQRLAEQIEGFLKQVTLAQLLDEVTVR